MSHRLSLHHVTAMEVSSAELVSIAATLGLRHVCLFTCVTPEAAALFPVEWTPATRRETVARCADLGVTAHNLEWFDITAEPQTELHRQGLELGAALGARTATTHVVDTDAARAADNFARFCDLAAEYDIAACIEFTPLIGTPDLASSLRVIDGAGRPNGGIALDILHLIRSGGSIDDIRVLAPHYIKSCQLSDGQRDRDLTQYFEETCFDRQVPGEGDFPLRDLLTVIPPDLILDVEVPLRARRLLGLGPLERARLAVEGARSIVESYN